MCGTNSTKNKCRMCRVLKPKEPRDQKVHCWHHLRGGCRRGDKCNFYHKGENEEVGDCPDYLEGKCAYGEQCMKGHHDESKLAVKTPPPEMHSQHFQSSDAVLDISVEKNLDEIEARSGPSAKRRLSMHSSEGAVSEGGDSLDSLSLQDFQGSASEEDKEEGAASGEEKDLFTKKDVRDAMVAFMKRNAEVQSTMAEFERNMMAEFRK
mmetsp:Transcript_19859/g.34278  ORF Transcript_19859/g.34278 Transcript_19859/m.34278 type:complete len:208 (-) Transcript_19859:384-1007(-)